MMKSETYLRLVLIALAVCVLYALVYQITQDRKHRMKSLIGFTAAPFTTLEGNQDKVDS